MCDLCKNNLKRSYTHSITRQHKKLLLKKMKEKKTQSIAKYGFFIWTQSSEPIFNFFQKNDN